MKNLITSSVLFMITSLLLTGCEKEPVTPFTRAGDSTRWSLVAGRYANMNECTSVLNKIHSYPATIRFSGSMGFNCRSTDAGGELIFAGNGFGATLGEDKQFNDFDLRFPFNPNVSGSKAEAYLNCQEIARLLSKPGRYLENDAIIEGPMTGACGTYDENNKYRLSIAVWRTSI